MALIKAQCTNCGGVLDVDETKEAAICPFCNTPYVVEKAINLYKVNDASINVQNANINVSGMLDADTMFENWVVTNDDRLRKDFTYYYGADPRVEYMKMWNGRREFIGEDFDKAEALINSIFSNERFQKYKTKELSEVIRLREERKATEIRREQEEAFKEQRKAIEKKKDTILLLSIFVPLGIIMLYLVLRFII